MHYIHKEYAMTVETATKMLQTCIFNEQNNNYCPESEFVILVDIFLSFSVKQIWEMNKFEVLYTTLCHDAYILLFSNFFFLYT